MVGGGQTVLVIEDDQLTLGLLAQIQTQCGYVIGAAATEAQARVMRERMAVTDVALDVDLGPSINGRCATVVARLGLRAVRGDRQRRSASRPRVGTSQWPPQRWRTVDRESRAHGALGAVDAVPVTTDLVLADALVGQATVIPTADSQLLAAAQHRQLDVAGPLEPRENP